MWTEHCAAPDEPDALKKWRVNKCVYMCVSGTRVCWLSSLLDLLNLIKHPSNRLVPLPTPATHAHTHTHTFFLEITVDLKDLQDFAPHLRPLGLSMRHVVWISVIDAYECIHFTSRKLFHSHSCQETRTSFSSAASYMFPARFKVLICQKIAWGVLSSMLESLFGFQSPPCSPRLGILA